MSSQSQLKPLSPQEWESLIDDYNHGGTRLFRWTAAHYSGTLLFELALSSIVRKDLPLNLKLYLLIFLEEHSSTVIPSAAAASFSRLIETLRSVVQSPNDGVSITFALKEQFLISTTSIFVTSNANGDSGSNTISSGLVPQFECLIELLLTIINRPNHSVDRQTRSVTCDCLRELEIAFPCLLSDVASQLWSLSQSERTHAGQSYALLLATVVSNIVKLKPNASFTNASMPLVPFNVPSFVIDDADNNATGEDKHSTEKQISDLSNKDLKRVVAFLLEWPHNLTSWGLLEFMDKILPVAAALDLQASLLKVQFSGLLSTYDPLLWHAYLVMCLRFLDSFEGQELEITRRLLLLSKESQHHLVFRLLVLHWLLGFVGLVLNRDEGKRGNVLEMSLSFYPAVFDPLALKSLKIDLLAYCSIGDDEQRPENVSGVNNGQRSNCNGKDMLSREITAVRPELTEDYGSWMVAPKPKRNYSKYQGNKNQGGADGGRKDQQENRKGKNHNVQSGSRYASLADATNEENDQYVEELAGDQGNKQNRAQGANTSKQSRGKRPTAQVSEKQIEGNNLHGIHRRQSERGEPSTRRSINKRVHQVQNNQAGAASEHTLVMGDKNGPDSVRVVETEVENDTECMGGSNCIHEHHDDPPDDAYFDIPEQPDTQGGDAFFEDSEAAAMELES